MSLSIHRRPAAPAQQFARKSRAKVHAGDFEELAIMSADVEVDVPRAQAQALGDRAAELPEHALISMVQGRSVDLDADYSVLDDPLILNDCKRRRRFKSSEEHRSAVRAVPCAEEDLHKWPQRMMAAHDTLPGACKKKLKGLLARGIVLTSHYSGMGTAEDSIAFASSAAMSLLGMHSSRLVKCYPACDSQSTCRKVLHESKRSLHIFGDLTQRMTEQTRERLKKALAEITAAFQAGRPAANRREQQRLLKEAGCHWCLRAWEILKGENFDGETSCWCFRCGRNCACFPVSSK